MAETSQDIKVFHLDTGRGWRGGQHQVYYLACGLHEMGVEQRVLCPADSPLAKRLKAAGVDVVALEVRGDFDFFAFRKLRKILETERPDILHVHDSHAHAAGWFATGEKSGVQLVVSRRVDFRISSNFFSSRKYRRASVRFIAISNGVRDVLVDGGVRPENIIIVASGVDPNRFENAPQPEAIRKEFGIGNDAPLVGTIGSLVDHKGHCYLIDAAALVLERLPQARFLIVGDGELRGNLERQITAKGLDGKVLLAGHRENVESFHAAFDLFVVSSHLEGLCTSLIDAMLSETACIGTDTGGVPDLIRDERTGLLVAPKHPQALADAIIRQLNERNAQWIENAKHHAQQSFTSEAMVHNTLDAYREFL